MGAAVIHRLFDEVLAGPRALEVLDEPLAPDYVDHSPVPGLPAGRDGVRRKLEGLRAAHRGAFAGVAPTGRRVTAKGMEHWDVIDEAGLMAQLKPEGSDS